MFAENNFHITTIAVNIPQRLFYWSDRTNASIYRATLDGQNVTRILSGKHGKLRGKGGEL